MRVNFSPYPVSLSIIVKLAVLSNLFDGNVAKFYHKKCNSFTFIKFEFLLYGLKMCNVYNISFANPC